MAIQAILADLVGSVFFCGLAVTRSRVLLRDLFADVLTLRCLRLSDTLLRLLFV